MSRLCMFVIACTAAATGARCAQLPWTSRSYYVQVAEALTSPSAGETMRIAPRMFEPVQLTEACQSRRIARLEAPARALDLRVGQGLALSTLRVVAVGDSGRAVPDVPVVIEAEERNPPVVQLRGDDPNLNAGRLMPIGTGAFRMRIRTLCTNTPAELIITGQVVR